MGKIVGFGIVVVLAGALIGANADVIFSGGAPVDMNNCLVREDMNNNLYGNDVLPGCAGTVVNAVTQK